MTATKTCRDCGNEFARSAQDYTVRCQTCRAHGRAAQKTRTYTAVACGRCGHIHTTLRCTRCGF